MYCVYPINQMQQNAASDKGLHFFLSVGQNLSRSPSNQSLIHFAEKGTKVAAYLLQIQYMCNNFSS